MFLTKISIIGEEVIKIRRNFKIIWFPEATKQPLLNSFFYVSKYFLKGSVFNAFVFKLSMIRLKII